MGLRPTHTEEHAPRRWVSCRAAGEASLGKHPARLCVPGPRVQEGTARVIPSEGEESLVIRADANPNRNGGPRALPTWNRPRR